MDNVQIKPSFWAMNAGAIIGFGMVVIDFLGYMYVEQTSQAMGLINLIIYAGFFAGIFISQKLFRDRVREGELRYDQALGIGLLTSMYASIIIGFYYYVLFTYDRELLGKMIEAVQQMYQQNGFSGKMMEDARKVSTPVTMGFSYVFNFTVIGLMASFVTSLLVKKTTIQNKKTDTNQ